jgi:8-oxo-dGTP pyrophosphatase MutT (NUDIX family)
MPKRTTPQTCFFSLVICRHPDGRFLAVEEINNRGWWVPGGAVDKDETLQEAAIRETKEEAGIDVILKGILRVECSRITEDFARERYPNLLFPFLSFQKI